MDVLAIVDDRGVVIRRRSSSGWDPVEAVVLGWTDPPNSCPVGTTSPPMGSWASVSVDSAGRLEAAVDQLGSEPLYWWSSGGRTVVASCVADLIEAAPVAREPCAGHLLELAGWTFGEWGETAWSSVQIIPAGHVLTADAGGARLKRYWRLRARLDNRADADEWGVRLREGLVDSLDRCIPDQPTAVAFSGGLDSSIIAGWANAHHSRRPTLLAALQYPGMPNDESYWQEAVAGDLGLPLLTVLPQEFDPNQYLARLEESALPVFRPAPESLELYRRLRTEGIAHVLTGLRGDELFAPMRWGVDEIVLQRRWEVLRRWWQTEGPSGVRDGMRRRMRDLRLPIGLQRRAERRRRPWIPDSAATVLGTRHVPARVWPGPHATGRMRVSYLMGGAGSVGSGVDAAMRRGSGICMRHPFADVPFVEMALGIPGSLLHSDDDDRALQRQVFAKYLPGPIQRRRGKVHFDYVYAQHLGHPWVREQLSTSRLAVAGLLDQQAVVTALDEVMASVAHGFADLPTTVGPLWTVVGVEAWWRRYME